MPSLTSYRAEEDLKRYMLPEELVQSVSRMTLRIKTRRLITVVIYDGNTLTLLFIECTMENSIFKIFSQNKEYLLVVRRIWHNFVNNGRDNIPLQLLIHGQVNISFKSPKYPRDCESLENYLCSFAL